MASEHDDHTKRPPMLKRLRRPTKPAAASADTRPGNISWIIGDACSKTPIPAVTFKSSTHHRNQNAEVRIASLGVTLATVCTFRTAPGGFHPGGGRRTVSTPNIMKQK